MKAKDIMTAKVITLAPETSVFKAIGALVDNKISGAPVTDKSGSLIGIVTEKDLLVSLDFIGQKNIHVVTVGEAMTRKVWTVGEDVPVQDISAELVRRNIKRVPIVRDQKVVGIVSRRDILRSVREASGSPKK